jgi:hypothetical protein
MAKYTVLIEGKMVAGLKSPGVGNTIEMTDLQAEHPLRIGEIELYKAPKAEPAAVDAPGKAPDPVAKPAV